MKSYLFAYGTLLEDRIREEVLGHCPAVMPSELRGFVMRSVVLDGIVYPIIAEDPGSEELIRGGYFEVTANDLERLDLYESEAYRRKQVRLTGDVLAWVYYQ